MGETSVNVTSQTRCQRVRTGKLGGCLLATASFNDLLRSYTDPDFRREELRYSNHYERTRQRCGCSMMYAVKTSRYSQ